MDTKLGKPPYEDHEKKELFSKIGQLQMEVNFLQKKLLWFLEMYDILCLKKQINSVFVNHVNCFVLLEQSINTSHNLKVR